MTTTRHRPDQSPKGVQAICLPNGSFRECFITVPAVGRETPAHLMRRLQAYLVARPKLRIARQDVFGQDTDPRAATSHGSPWVARGDWPVTWVGQGNGGGCPVAGVQVHAVSGIDVTPLRLGEQPVGAVYEDEYTRYCELGGLQPRSVNKSRIHQASEIMGLMEECLGLAGMTFANVFRTWFYLHDILDWYDDFNRVRNAFFRRRRVYEGLVPASTGVGGSNPMGAAVVANLMAIQAKSPAVRLDPVPSPLQCPALKYGSAFNRAVELILPTQRRLYVSGTASIGPDGRTAHVDDVDGQVALTMQVVEAILQSRGMGWGDVTRAIGYFKHAEEAPAFKRYCRKHKLPPLPTIIAKNDICRDDLLFEIEVDAVRLTRSGAAPRKGAAA